MMADFDRRLAELAATTPARSLLVRQAHLGVGLSHQDGNSRLHAPGRALGDMGSRLETVQPAALAWRTRLEEPPPPLSTGLPAVLAAGAADHIRFSNAFRYGQMSRRAALPQCGVALPDVRCCRQRF
jgi:hypothetical protein